MPPYSPFPLKKEKDEIDEISEGLNALSLSSAALNYDPRHVLNEFEQRISYKTLGTDDNLDFKHDILLDKRPRVFMNKMGYGRRVYCKEMFVVMGNSIFGYEKLRYPLFFRLF